MNLKVIPLFEILVLGTIKLMYSVNVKSRFDIIFGILITICFIQITWAYWKDKDMLAPPNFNYNNGENSLPRAMFVVAMMVCYLMFVVGA